MVAELFTYAGEERDHIIRAAHENLMESCGLMALQDMALFFKKIKSGLYGELYGKMNGMWIAGKIVNFQKSVNYNVIREKEAEHYARKQMDGDRDLANYYDDIRPETIE